VTGFAFLCAATDEARVAALRRSIDALEAPEGVEIGFFEVRDPPSLAAAYNRLRRDAAGWRYKAYVHQDVEILNRALVADALRIFGRRRVAMIGAAGCRWLPDSLVWWDGSGVFGHVLERHGDGAVRPLRLEEPAGEVEVVEAADGLCLITQHDLEWDEAIPGFHFYDVAQSTRFTLAGYDVVVPRQSEPWFLHDAAPPESVDPEAYDRSRDVYRERYDDARRRFWRSPVRRRLRRLRAARLAIALLAAVVVACGFASRPGGSGIVSVTGRVGPLRLDESRRGDVIAFAGRPDVETKGRGDGGARYDALGYDCTSKPARTGLPLRGDSGARGTYCRTAFYVDRRTGRFETFFTTASGYSESHGVRVGMPTAKAERLLRIPRKVGCESDIYLYGSRATLTVAFVGGKAQANLHVVGGRVFGFVLHSKRRDPDLFDCL
jgi:hypothetical protein